MADTAILEEAPTVTEPKRVVNWELGKVLHYQGLNFTQIAKELGVTSPAVRQHAVRHKWNELKHALLSVKVSESRQVAKATNLRSKLANKANVLADSLPDSPVPLSKLGSIASAARDIATMSAAIEGWSDNTTTKLDIHVLSSGEAELAVPQLEAGTMEEKACLPEPPAPGETG